ncbi:hypothetical protein [Oscillatoria salina]|uniref:hypothetical protein n=1 Tax=Oscillatoria salina TaxID=331517 RepID=UPI0013BC2650|nr:hypothetical protein [Oscillatoria salina]MBZ8181726.1 hypothetical protein [Oscillatoria salina IIICB1]NET90354.1 hypothetical protein [Kamptonema sp. SIO1D9]
MFQNARGIPGLPDLTHPDELINFGIQLLKLFGVVAILICVLGVAIALMSFSLRRRNTESEIFVFQWFRRYDTWLKSLQHGALILALLVVGFLLFSTLSNRYHHWEQAKVAQVAASVEGERLTQPAPGVRYLVEEPYTYTTFVDGQPVQVEEIQKVSRSLTLDSSSISVNINEVKNLANNKSNYSVDFSALYQVTNSLAEGEDFFFEIAPPYSYLLLQNFRVEREEEILQPSNQGVYSFPFRLESGESTQFRVIYQAQGSPRWVYEAGGQLLSNFRLTINTNFKNADFASGITPTEIENRQNGTVFTWIFTENVSVQNPFGVFTATERITNTGILPRLLILAPAVFLWWLLLLYLSIPLSLRNVAIAGGLFFACLLALTYFSRVMAPTFAWSIISLVLLGLVWGLGKSRSTSLAAVICTIAGAIAPIFGLLVPYSGLTLSLAGLLSAIWLTILNWYDWKPLR